MLVQTMAVFFLGALCFLPMCLLPISLLNPCIGSTTLLKKGRMSWIATEVLVKNHFMTNDLGVSNDVVFLS